MDSMNMRFIGIDLAWSARNTCAAVALAWNGKTAYWLSWSERLRHDAEIIAFVKQAAGSQQALVALDAPLIVPNKDGMRPVDKEITHLFGRYHAGCYPANRKRCTRGEEIVKALNAEGFVQDPFIQKNEALRKVFEVYPHPAMIALFRLGKTLKYKARPGRSLESRQSELIRLRACLIGLEKSVPPMFIPRKVKDLAPSALSGSELKRYEDLLDAAVCAYIALYAWYWGPDGYHVYGDMTRGYIVIPMTDWMRERLWSGIPRTQS